MDTMVAQVRNSKLRVSLASFLLVILFLTLALLVAGCDTNTNQAYIKMFDQVSNQWDYSLLNTFHNQGNLESSLRNGLSKTYGEKDSIFPLPFPIDSRVSKWARTAQDILPRDRDLVESRNYLLLALSSTRLVNEELSQLEIQAAVSDGPLPNTYIDQRIQHVESLDSIANEALSHARGLVERYKANHSP